MDEALAILPEAAGLYLEDEPLPEPPSHTPAYAETMSAQPDDIAATPPNVVDIGGEKAVVIPLTEYRAMKALADRATPEEREDAWFDAAIAEAEDWEAAGRPGGTIPHELVVAEMEAAWRSTGGQQ